MGVGAKSEPEGTLTFSFVSAVKRALARFCAADTELLRLPIIVSVRLMRDCAVARSARAALGIAFKQLPKFRHESAEVLKNHDTTDGKCYYYRYARF